MDVLAGCRGTAQAADISSLDWNFVACKATLSIQPEMVTRMAKG
jgi:hypothetical protein